MADFSTPRYVLEDGRVPLICMRCGAPAVTLRTKFLYEQAAWVTVLSTLTGAIPVALARCYVVVPFCAVHKNHWVWRVFWPLVVLLGAVVLIASALADHASLLSGWLCFGGVLGLVASVIVSATTHHTSIHAKVITDDVIVLGGVSHRFIEAFNRHPVDRELAEQDHFEPGTGPGEQPRNPDS